MTDSNGTNFTKFEKTIVEIDIINISKEIKLIISF